MGFEPRFKLPKLACYHYTTSSIIPDSPSGLATLLCIQYVRPLAILPCGAHSWIRTSDLRVISTLLYRLSYASIFMIMKSKLFIIILYHIFFKKSNNFFWPRQLLWFFVALPAELLPYIGSRSSLSSSPTPPCQVNLGRGGWIRTNDTRIWSQS